MSAEIVPYDSKRSTERKPLGGIDGSGGGGHPPDMEQRVAHLEADVGEIKDILKRLEPAITRLVSDVARMDERGRKLDLDVAELKGRISQLPTTVTLIGFVLAVLGIAGLAKFFAL